MKQELSYTMTEQEAKPKVDVSYFFDTYAVMEIIRANKDYRKYTLSNIITTNLNLFELFYHVLKAVDEITAKSVLSKYSKFAVDFDNEVIAEAATFRFNHKKKNLSMTDCIGYVVAKKRGIKFLTGDKEFEKFDNVEFVK